MIAQMKKGLFFDRDGTLIRDKGYICRYSDVELFSFAVEAIRLANEKGFSAVGITNQSAVARGICTVSQVEDIHRQLIQKLRKENAYIEHIYYCPYLAEGKIAEYRIDSEMRKPRPGMLQKASEEMQIPLAPSIMVGDSYRDILSGINAGCRTGLVMTGNGPEAEKQLQAEGIVPDYIADNLLDLVRML